MGSSKRLSHSSTARLLVMMKLAHFTRLLSESPDVPRLLGDNPGGIVRNLLIFGCVGGCAPALLSWLADRELELVERTLPRPTPHLRFVKGYVLITLKRYYEALECLEAVTEERPDFAPAYDHATQCAFKSGDRAKGLRHAKKARMLGMFAEHWAWGPGVYSSRSKGCGRGPR